MASSVSSDFDIAKSRAQFPALQQDHQVYFDNAGGSQVLGTVAASYDSTLLDLCYMFAYFQRYPQPSLS